MTDRHITIIGAYFLGAVYLFSVVAAGLVWMRGAAVGLAIVSAGLGYLCQIAATFADEDTPVASVLGGVAYLLWAMSGLAGAMAGIFVLV